MVADTDAKSALDHLADCTTPLLIGVRHHSAALARVMSTLLDEFSPQAILLEMPPDFQSWMSFLGRDELEAPVALAACGETQLLSFYPLADFSPELAAVRWAAKHGVPVIACDLDLVSMQSLEFPDASHDQDAPLALDDSGEPEPEVLSRDELVSVLLARTGSRDTGDLWERLVETPAAQSSPEMIRRAGLLFGWAIRHSSGGPTPRDAHRESAMRDAIAAAPKRSAAIIGAFHAAALLPEPIRWSKPNPIAKPKKPAVQPTTSLVSYSFAQLDQRSGYPAGVMDPVWQQTMLAAENPAHANQLIADLAVKLCRQLRREGHVAGTPDASEIVRLAVDLGRLRGYAAAGRGELLEAIETSLVQGDLLGRGRAVAAAAQKVLVGSRRGRLPHDTPRSGLAPQIEETVRRLKLPGPDEIDQDAKDFRLDPLRSKLDRARAVVLRRLNLIGVQHAQRFDTESVGHRDNLTEAWRVQWTHATSATVEAAGMRGVTLMQASEAAVARIRHTDSDDDVDTQQLHPATLLMRLGAAAECGLPELTKRILQRVDGDFVQSASTAQLVEAASWIQRIAAGHIPGLPIRDEDAAVPDVGVFSNSERLNPLPLVEAAVRQLEGLRGSDQASDVITIVELASMIRSDDPASSANELGSLLPSLRWWLTRTRRNGSSRMQGAAWGTLAMLAVVDIDRLSRVQSGWYDAASGGEGRKNLRDRIAGMIVPLLPLVSADPAWLSGLEERLASSPDDHFLSRLPALRAGFQSLAPNDRARLLRDRLLILQPDGPAARGHRIIDAPELLAAATTADRAGRAAVADLLPELKLRDVTRTDVEATARSISEPPGEIRLADRWRLVLGVQGSTSPRARRLASTLDQLYGTSTSEGTGGRADLVGPGQGGSEKAQPSVRQWVEDVGSLFGKDVCEEVMGEAAAGGRAAVLEYLNTDQVRPSIELLEQVLSLRGALPERELGLLRNLAARITRCLAEQLANRLRPALSGLSTPRPTRRRSRRLDLPRTLRDNLSTAHKRDDGRVGIAPHHMVFRSPARRHMDWHLIFVVGVSGSMEPSVIYSAMMAAVFSSLPAIDVRFFAFSTDVIDFSDHVDDPLSLLLEVQVGGGTHIGLGLRAAREAVRNPSRTLVVVVSDFEEGVSLPGMLAEVRMLADSGVKLLGLAALDDDAKPRYHAGNAAAAAAAGMSVAAVSPERLAGWVGDQIRGASR